MDTPTQTATLPIAEFTRLALLTTTLREGKFSEPANRRYGEETTLWQQLKQLVPEKLSDGTFRGDASFFLSMPVHRPLQSLQRMLSQLAQTVPIPPNPGEHLTNEYIPRIINAVAAARSAEMGSDVVTLTPEFAQIITPMDIQNLRTYIIATFDLGGYAPEEQEKLLDQIGQMVFQGFLETAHDRMSETDQTEFEKLLETANDPDTLFEFIEKTIPDFDQLLANEVTKLRAEYMDTQSVLNTMNAQQPTDTATPSVPHKPE